ncbi:hypothetical protein [Leptospira interrogans]|nr:hypothetical protein [Leptospira interrogans]
MDGFGTSSKVIEAVCFSLSEAIGVTIHKPEITDTTTEAITRFR